jgi:hypothetical protein
MASERTHATSFTTSCRLLAPSLQPEDIGVKPALNRRGGGLHQADVADALAASASSPALKVPPSAPPSPPRRRPCAPGR